MCFGEPLGAEQSLVFFLKHQLPLLGNVSSREATRRLAPAVSPLRGGQFNQVILYRAASFHHLPSTALSTAPALTAALMRARWLESCGTWLQFSAFVACGCCFGSVGAFVLSAWAPGGYSRHSPVNTDHTNSEPKCISRALSLSVPSDLRTDRIAREQHLPSLQVLKLSLNHD